ncbi:radical SAM protein, partial [Treponema socranskii]|uniref:radical SAM protein n=1 Tax=Treponema socranskii TaxID=53419 RepID=UPI00360E3865
MTRGSIPEALLHAKAGVLVKTTLVDFPGRVASSLFLRGCNLRCPYCYNAGLVLGGEAATDDSYATAEEVFLHLEKRKNVLTGFVVSGGEPLINPLTPYLVPYAKALGYRVKLDTNGTLPDELNALIEDDTMRPDFIAMDIKTSPSRYGELLGSLKTQDKSTAAKIAEDFSSRIAAAARLTSSLPPSSREWRTVLVPPLVTKRDIREMAALLPSDASWRFAQFRNENCIDPAYNDIAPYSDAEAASLVAYAKTFIEDSELR